MSDIYSSLNSIYSQSGFSEKYGGSIFVTIITIIVFFLLISYFNILINIEPIKRDWVNQRCSPGIMPFAGIINPPANKSAFQYTNDNFAECTQGILKRVSGIFLIPINMFVQFIHGIFNMIMASINTARKMLNMIRVNVKKIVEDLMGKILNIMIPLQKVVMSINDLFGKVQGIMASAIYTALGTYYTMRSSVGAFFQFVVILLTVIAAMVVAFWMIPFTWGIAIAMTVVFVSIAIPLGMIADALRRAFDLSLPGLPGKPSCFAKNTKIYTQHGMVPIEHLRVGTYLENGSVVTATMKLNAHGHTMYNLRGVIVSGEHSVLYNNTTIPVCKHPDSKKIESFQDPIIYCFNTNNKFIYIQDLVFSDWDELTPDNIEELRHNCKKYITQKSHKLSFIHKYLESGFHKHTSIDMLDGTTKYIRDVKLFDKLKQGETVLGLVEIEAKDIPTYTYYLKNNVELVGGPNIQFHDIHLGVIHTLDNQITKKLHKPSRKLYHLLTDKNTFTIYNHIVYDYNGSVDNFITNTQTQLKVHSV